MFRDESTKVMQKAHARWGFDPADGTAGPSDGSPTDAELADDGGLAPARMSAGGQALSLGSASPGSEGGRSRIGSVDDRNGPQMPLTPVSDHSSPYSRSMATIPKAVPTSLPELGRQFYVERYVLGFPDEPKTPHEIGSQLWVQEQSATTIMGAVGLASLANLKGDQRMMLASRQQYVLGLQYIGQAIMNPAATQPDVAMRNVVNLALYEVVNGTHEATDSARAHIMGAAALLRSLMDTQKRIPDGENAEKLRTGGFQGLIQLCYSMLTPCYHAAIALPPAYNDWLRMTQGVLPPEEEPAAFLLPILSRFVDTTAYISRTVLSDGSPATDAVLRDILEMEQQLATWESLDLDGRWICTTKEGKYPPAACYKGRYHRYSSMWAARIWGHYRWGRLVVNETIIEFIATHPQSSANVFPRDQLAASMALIRRVAEDVLVSISAHWKHPSLTPEQKTEIETAGGAGAGAAGVPNTMHHLHCAAIAPGMPYEAFRWAVDTTEAIWRDMGIMQARTLADSLHKHEQTLLHRHRHPRAEDGRSIKIEYLS